MNKVPLELPAVKSRETTRTRSLSMPFANVMQSLDLTRNLNKIREINKSIRKSQEIFVPSGGKSYNETGLQEMNVRAKGRNDEYKQRYLGILTFNPTAFHKNTGEFTMYSDCSVRINRTGPYNRKK